MFRAGTYWASVAHIAVDMKTGTIKVEKMTISVDPGIVVNPMQLKRQIEGGTVMGVGAVLARGCTSGQALTGGALLSVGSWTFMLSAFAAGYVVAPALKRAWQ